MSAPPACPVFSSCWESSKANSSIPLSRATHSLFLSCTGLRQRSPHSPTEPLTDRWAEVRHFGQWEFWVMWCGSHVADSNITTPLWNSFCSTTLQIPEVQGWEEDHKPGLGALYSVYMTFLSSPCRLQPRKSEMTLYTELPSNLPWSCKSGMAPNTWERRNNKKRAFLSHFVTVWWEVFIRIRNRACYDLGSRLACRRSTYEVSGHSFSTASSKSLTSPLQEAFAACFCLSYPGRPTGALSRPWFGKC